MQSMEMVPPWRHYSSSHGTLHSTLVCLSMGIMQKLPNQSNHPPKRFENSWWASAKGSQWQVQVTRSTARFSLDGMFMSPTPQARFFHDVKSPGSKGLRVRDEINYFTFVYSASLVRTAWFVSVVSRWVKLAPLCWEVPQTRSWMKQTDRCTMHFVSSLKQWRRHEQYMVEVRIVNVLNFNQQHTEVFTKIFIHPYGYIFIIYSECIFKIIFLDNNLNISLIHRLQWNPHGQGCYGCCCPCSW